MIVIYCLVYALAGNLLINGLLHLMMGLLGKRFTRRPKMVTERQFAKVYQGRLFSSAVFNAVYGLVHVLGALLVLITVGSFTFGLTLETGALSVGIAAGTLLLSWKYEGTIS